MLGRIPICWSSWWIRIYISHPDLDIASVSILLSPLQVAAVRGCIPVIMMDGVKSEFEDELPLIEYAIRIPGYMAYRYGPLAAHLTACSLAAHLAARSSHNLHTYAPPKTSLLPTHASLLPDRYLRQPHGIQDARTFPPPGLRPLIHFPDQLVPRTPAILQKFIDSGKVAQMQVWEV